MNLDISVKYPHAPLQSQTLALGLNLWLGIRLGSELELRTGLGLEWYLRLEFGSIYQYNRGMQAEIICTSLFSVVG